jgi:purine nucleoside permease
MNTLFSSVSGNSFRKALASVALVAAVFVAPAVSAQSITAQSNVTSITKSADRFQAFVHPIENTVSMKVHVLNPEKGNVTITIHNQDNILAYRKTLGRNAVYHGTFDMSKLADGEYNVTVSSRRGTYTRKLNLATQRTRYALAQ